VITGFFIIFEDQFGVGDNVMINTNLQIRGNIDEVGLRITKVRAYTGEMHIIPNSQILQVTNYSKTSSLAILDVAVSFEEDLEKVFDVLRRVGAEAEGQVENMTGVPEVLGLQMMGPSQMIVRMTVECAPMEQFAVSRVLRKRIKEAFEREGIAIPYPKNVTVFQKNDTVPFQKEQE
jgi:small conductance mechanosensitive channel